MNVRNFLFMNLTGKVLPFANLEDIMLAQTLGEKLRTIIGNPLTFRTKKAQKALNPSLTLLPVQDLHGYDHAWIGGMSEQLLDESTAEQGTIDQTTGEDAPSSGVKRSDFMLTKGATNIFLGTQYGSMRFFWYDSNKTYLSNDVCNVLTSVAVPNNTAYFRLIGINRIWNYSIMINSGTTAKTYCHYENICLISGRDSAEIVVKDADEVTQSTVTFTFDQIVYGGTINLDTGVMSIDTPRVDLGTMNWNTTSTSGVFYADDDLSGFIGTGKTIVSCDSFLCCDNVSGLGQARLNPNGSICGYSGSGTHRWYIRYDEITSKTDLIAAVNGVYACYKLATPTTIQLTPQEINLLKGINNVWTDGDSIELTYKG